MTSKQMSVLSSVAQRRVTVKGRKPIPIPPRYNEINIDLRYHFCYTFQIIVNLRINETLQTGAVRIPHPPVSRLIGAVSNCADAVRLKTAPTGAAKVSIYF